MKKMVRKFQYLKDFLYNGKKVLMLETTPKQKKQKKSSQKQVQQKKPKTVFIMTDKALHVGMCQNQKGKIELCVLWHEPLMEWKDYSVFLKKGEPRVINIIPKSREVEKNSIDTSELASEIAYYIEKEKIIGSVYLIGFKDAGAIMYDVAIKLQHHEKRSVYVVTAFTDFEKNGLKKGVSEEVNHTAFSYTNENWPEERGVDYVFIPHKHKHYYTLDEVLKDFARFMI